jgi:hypothetical protein
MRRAAFVLVALAGCSASSGGAPTATAPAATVAPAVQSAPAPVEPAVVPPDIADSCTIVTPADIDAVFGGDVAAGTVNGDDGSCVYVIAGGAEATVGVDREYISFDTAHASLPTIEQVTVGGRPGWFYPKLHQLHIDLDGSALVVSTTVTGDETALKNKVIGLAKVALGKL